jgi:ATP-dependent helicase/nuclease subunit A
MTVATFIEANAGTGKTYELTNHILARVEAGLPLDRICAVTFTEKAANEMVDRMRQKIHERVAAGALPPRVLDQSNHCFIGTIHSFCTQILKRYGSKLHLSPLFAVDADEFQFLELFASRWDQFLSRILRQEIEPYGHLIRIFGFRVLELLAKKLAQRRYEFAGAGNDIRWMQPLLQNNDLWDIGPNRKWDQALLTALEDPANNRAILTAMLSARVAVTDASWKRAIKDFVYCRHEEMHTAIKRLRQDFVDPLLAEYRSLGFLRYDDLILDVRNLLRDHLQVRRRLKHRYELVLVDEMQDTDPVQYELFLYMCESLQQESAFTLQDLASGKARLRLEPGKLFVVGDPKQSIYGFRSADADAYERIKEILQKETVEVLPLTDNYRSCDNIVKFSNALAQKLFPDRGVKDSVTKRTGFCPGKPIHQCVHLVNLDAPDADAQHLRVLAEANWLAQKIRAIAAASSKDKPYRGIGILLRKLTSGHLYIDALSAHEIPVVIEGEKFFFQSQEVIDFLNLLKCVVDDMDPIALAGVLRSPLFGLNDLELALFFQQYRRDFNVAASLELVLQQSPESRKTALLHFLQGIADLRKDLIQQTPGRFVDEVLRRLPVLAIAGNAYGSYRSEIAPLNILKIHRQALEADQDPVMSPYRFVKTLEQFSRQAKELGQEVVADEGVDAVRMMSIHRSKGLDFPIVFVPMTDYGVSSHEGAVDVRHDWRTNLSGIKIKPYTEANYLQLVYGEAGAAQAMDEEDRVLYVAATRARHELYFSLVEKGLKKDHRGLQNMNLLRDLHPDVPVVSEPSSPWIEPDAAGDAPPGQDLAAVIQDWKKIETKHAEVSEPQMRAITTEAKAYLEKEHYYPTGSSQALLVGLICHGVLERIDFRASENFRELIDLETSKLSNDHPSGDLILACRESGEILQAFFQSQAARWLASVEILGREVPVVLFDSIGNKILSGTIDLLAHDGSTHYVIDYKTDRTVDKPALETYANQMRLYSQAFANTLPSPPSTRLCLLRQGTITEP